MKIFWLVNGMLPMVAKELNIKAGVNEGWLVGLSNEILSANQHELAICFPQTIKEGVIEGKVEGLQYFGYPLCGNKEIYNPNLETVFAKILKCYRPDVIHIMGSEYPHTYSMVCACENLGMLQYMVISIQGLISVYSQHVTTGIPNKYLSKVYLRDWIKKDTIKSIVRKYSQRGEYEIRALKKTKNIIGRTTWDYACTKLINPTRKYYHNGETLRPAFYEKKWDINNCEKYSIFFSQATSPIKGFHYMIRALHEISIVYPSVKLYVAAYARYDEYMKRLECLNPQYARYICKLIRELKVENNIVYCGSLDEIQMRDRFLKAHVFVSASTIENSPNSVGEAMMLGVPVVSSDVGGVRDLITNSNEGVIYSVDAPYMLAHHVMEIFRNDNYARKLSIGEIERANVIHNREKNYNELMEIYNSLGVKRRENTNEAFT